MIARGFPGVNFLFGLLIGHPGVDAFKNLALGEASVFEGADFRPVHDRQAGDVAAKNEVHSRVGKADELERYGIHANRIQLVHASDIQDLLLGETCAGEASGGIAAHKGMLMSARIGDQRDAGVVTDTGLLGLANLGDFVVSKVQTLEQFDIAGPHADLIERTIVRQGMRMAARQKQDTSTGK